MQKTGKMQTDNCLQLPKYAIIVAGGKGLRMGGEIPKQFRPISGHPVLMHTLEAFYRYDPEIRIILVLPEEHQNYWNDLCLQYRFTLKHRVVTGGPTRFHSVKNGLDTLPDNGLVAVHDGVRPLVSEEVIDNAFEEAKRSGAVIQNRTFERSIQPTVLRLLHRRRISRRGYRQRGQVDKRKCGKHKNYNPERFVIGRNVIIPCLIYRPAT